MSLSLLHAKRSPTGPSTAHPPAAQACPFGPPLLSTTRSRQFARRCHSAVHQRMELRQGDLMAAMHEPIGAPETQPIPRNELHLLGTPGWSGRHPSRFPRSNLASRLAGQCDANLEGEPWVPALCAGYLHRVGCEPVPWFVFCPTPRGTPVGTPANRGVRVQDQSLQLGGYLDS